MGGAGHMGWMVRAREQDLRLASLGPAVGWDPHWSPSCPQEKRRERKKMGMKKRCSVMSARGPTALPQMGKLGVREDKEGTGQSS